MDRDSFREVYALAQDWARRTDQAEKAEFRRLGIGYNKDLFPTIASKVSSPGSGLVAIEHSFLVYGRFVDMGAGPGSADRRGSASVQRAVDTVENRERNRERATGKKKKVRRAKKFYSVIFYGRLNALMGVVSGSMQESTVSLVQQVDENSK